MPTTGCGTFEPCQRIRSNRQGPPTISCSGAGGAAAALAFAASHCGSGRPTGLQRSVDRNTKKAVVQFDEAILPVQAVAAAIERTPHMMGSGMRYSGWLALKVPSITDDTNGQKVKQVLGKVEGIKTVAVYPTQH